MDQKNQEIAISLQKNLKQIQTFASLFVTEGKKAETPEEKTFNQILYLASLALNYAGMIK